MRLTRRPPGLERWPPVVWRHPAPPLFFQTDCAYILKSVLCLPALLPPPHPSPDKSYHCPSPKKMPFSKMDPSCTIGFYSRSAQDYERIRQELSKVGGSSAFTPPQEPRPVFLTASVLLGNVRCFVTNDSNFT